MTVKDGIITNQYRAPAVDLKPLEDKVEKVISDLAEMQTDVTTIKTKVTELKESRNG